MPITDVYQVERVLREGRLSDGQFEWVVQGPGSMSAFSDSWPARYDDQRLWVKLALYAIDGSESKEVRVHMYTLVSIDHHHELFVFAARLVDPVDSCTPNLLVGWYNCRNRDGECNLVLD